MRFAEALPAGASWAGVALVQVTLVALLGLLAWLVVRRSGPALRAAILLAALAGLLAAPGLATVAPVWFPLPACVCAGPSATEGGADVPAPLPSPPTDPAVLAFLVAQPPAEMPPGSDGPVAQGNDAKPTAVKAEAVLINLAIPPDEAAPPTARSGAPARSSWPVAGMLAVVWLAGALVCMAYSLLRLALLYRCARRARPIREAEWVDHLASLAKTHGMPPVALRESRDIASPLTLGLFRPVILLPHGRRHWSAEQRTLILVHELAHVRRRDFLAGLVAELARCLCWFHPLVRYLTGRLRLEQEYAADAWAASAATDPTDYVRCLARLALERGGGRGSLAPAFWRRRAEILRRIDMLRHNLRHNPEGLPLPLRRRTAWTVAGLAAAACLAVAGVGPLRSAAEDAKPAAPGSDTPQVTTDVNGDSLPAGARARLGTTRLRHGSEVTFVAFGPDGKTVVTAGRDNTLRVWDLANGKEIRRLPRLKPVATKPPRKGGKAAAEKDQVAVMLRRMAGGGGNYCVALSPAGKTLAVDCGGNAIQLWDVKTGKELRQIQGPPGGLVGLLFSPDGRKLAGQSSGRALFVWETDTGKEVAKIKPTPRPGGNNVVLFFGGGGFSAATPGIAFTPDSKQLVAAARDYKKNNAAVGSVKFWDVATSKEVRKVPSPGGARVSTVALTPDGKTLAYATGGVVHLCEANTGKEVRKLQTNDGGIGTLTFSPDGKTLAVRGRNQRVRLWEVQTGKEVRQFSGSAPPPRGGGGGFVLTSPDFFGPETRALAFSPDGKRIAAAAGSTVRVWGAATGKELPLPVGHGRAPTAIVLSRDGRVAVSWGADQVVRRWEATTGKSLGAFPAPPRTTRATLAPDSKTVALANGDGTIRLHDTATGKERNRLTGGGGAAALAFTADGKTLAVRGNDNTIRLYDVAGGTEIRQIALRPGPNPNRGTVIFLGGGGQGARGPGLAFSPDGKLLVATAPAGGRNPGQALVLLDVAAGKELRKIASPQAVTSFAFAPDGRTLATENADRTITLWEVASGKERARLGKAPARGRRGNDDGRAFFTVAVDGMAIDQSPPAGPVGLAFSPDGRALAARGPDLSVHVWDVAAGKEVSRLQGHMGRVETVAFAPDGKTLASGATDTTVLVWDAAGPRKGLVGPKAGKLPKEQAEAIWTDLAGEDAARSLQGISELAAAPKQAVPFLAVRLKPAARVDPKKLAGWIADLESEKFAVRRDAAASLLKVGEQAVPALQKVLAASPPLETRKRVEDLVNQLTGGTLTTEQLRVVRAVEALERMGTPEARRLLQALAGGAPGALPTREAQAALQRLKDKR